MKVIKLIFTLLICCFFSVSNAQIFGKIIDSASDKMSQKLEDRIVKEISNEIAKAAMKPIDNAIDDMLRDRYEADSISGKTKMDYSNFATSFLQPVNLPDSYSFDVTLEAVTKDYDGDKSEMEILMSKSGGLIAFIQEDDGKNVMMVIDIDNDVIAVYNEEDKTVQGLPTMLTLMGAMDSAYGEEGTYEVTIRKTGKTKKIAKYHCDEWEIDDEKTVTSSYVAKDFPISWQESFTPYVKEVLPTTTRDKMPEGMVLKSEVKTKAKNKKSKFEVKKVIEGTVLINNKEYTQRTYSADNN